MEDMHAYLNKLGFFPKGKEAELGSYSVVLGNDLAIKARDGRPTHYPLDSCMAIRSAGHSGESLTPIRGYNEETLKGFLDVPQNGIVAVVYKGKFYIKEQKAARIPQ